MYSFHVMENCLPLKVNVKSGRVSNLIQSTVYIARAPTIHYSTIVNSAHQLSTYTSLIIGQEYGEIKLLPTYNIGPI